MFKEHRICTCHVIVVIVVVVYLYKQSYMMQIEDRVPFWMLDSAEYFYLLRLFLRQLHFMDETIIVDILKGRLSMHMVEGKLLFEAMGSFKYGKQFS